MQIGVVFPQYEVGADLGGGLVGADAHVQRLCEARAVLGA